MTTPANTPPDGREAMRSRIRGAVERELLHDSVDSDRVARKVLRSLRLAEDEGAVIALANAVRRVTVRRANDYGHGSYTNRDAARDLLRSLDRYLQGEDVASDGENT